MRHKLHQYFHSVAAFAIASSSIMTIKTKAIQTPNQGQAAARGLLLEAARSFYRKHSDLIKESHGIHHWERVHHHACNAIEYLETTENLRQRLLLSEDQTIEIEAAALLHDVDDDKYFPKAAAVGTNEETDRQSIDSKTKNEREHYYASLYPNALELLQEAKIPEQSYETILFMIDAVSCSKNGNSVPMRVDNSSRHQNNGTHDDDGATNQYYLLIPRWSDRIEAVGARGVWRCYQYNQEKKRSLCLPGVSPRPRSEDELWSHVVPERFEAYMKAEDGGTRDPSMIGHYYDKLLHVACPPREIVRNDYLEEKLRDSAEELVEVCLRYGRSGVVDEEYIRSFQDQ